MNEHKTISFVDSAKQISVIEVNTIRGTGTPIDPITKVTEYFLLDGTRLAKVYIPEEIQQYLEK